MITRGEVMIRRIALLLLMLAAGNAFSGETKPPPNRCRAEQIRSMLENASNKNILVVAHRADWKNAPENSRLAVLNAIDMGVDIIEIDVRKTKDGKFVLMHDKTVNRTTNGKGRVSDLTLEQLLKLHLKGPDGSLTEERIPTLHDILEQCKGKVLVNLDKVDRYFNELTPILERTETSRQVIFKGNFSPKEVGIFLDNNQDILYMSKFKFKESMGPAEIKAMYPIEQRVRVVEVKFQNSDHPAVSVDSLKKLKQMNVRTWVNTLAVSHSADYTDKKALRKPEEVWGTLIGRGFSVIQTDEPKALLKYLREKSLHD